MARQVWISIFKLSRRENPVEPSGPRSSAIENGVWFAWRVRTRQFWRVCAHVKQDDYNVDDNDDVVKPRLVCACVRTCVVRFLRVEIIFFIRRKRERTRLTGKTRIFYFYLINIVVSPFLIACDFRHTTLRVNISTTQRPGYVTYVRARIFFSLHPYRSGTFGCLAHGDVTNALCRYITRRKRVERNSSVIIIFGYVNGDLKSFSMRFPLCARKYNATYEAVADRPANTVSLRRNFIFVRCDGKRRPLMHARRCPVVWAIALEYRSVLSSVRMMRCRHIAVKHTHSALAFHTVPGLATFT